MPPLTKAEVLARIDKGESFDGVEIGEVDFRGHVFEKAVNFSEAKFLGKADFFGATFKEACFNGATFSEKADFYKATFKEAYFIGATFSEAYFIGATFSAEAYFYKATFAEADFRVATFSAEANFSEATFSVKAYFRGATFSERVIFDGGEAKKVFAEEQPTLFINVIFEKPERVIFRSANLHKCSFINTDIPKVDFTDVEWEIKNGRKVIYDEQVVNEEKNYKLVEKVYRQLKKNYEDRGSYGEAGDFHYGEMEMRRLAQKGIFKYISITSLYKILSGYGEKHWLAFIWLGFFILLFSSAYLMFGLESNAANINYDLALNFNTFFKPSFWQDYPYNDT